MALDSFSVFYYGHEITVINNFINFDEGSGELSAELAVGFYSLTEFTDEVESALNDVGTLTYTVSANRNTRLITISATGSFDLLFSTGSQAATSTYELLGFTASDFTSASSYVGSASSGLIYKPQFKLQSYVDADDNLNFVDSSVNQSANGRVQVIRYGTERFYEMNFKYLTNLLMDGKVILNNPTGIEDIRSFMDYIVNKSPIEFMPDVGDRSTFYTVLLESTSDSKNGTGYKLREMVNENVPNIYETGVMKFRLLED